MVALVTAPLTLGAVRLWSLVVMAALVGVAALAGAVAGPRGVPWPALAAVGVALFAGLQAVPLPRGLLAWLSPHGLELVELSLGDVASHSLSLDPAGSAREL